jgi:hypothetical protein
VGLHHSTLDEEDGLQHVDGRHWWTLISDLRTVLEKNPVPIDEIKALLGEVV